MLNSTFSRDSCLWSCLKHRKVLRWSIFIQPNKALIPGGHVESVASSLILWQRWREKKIWAYQTSPGWAVTTGGNWLMSWWVRRSLRTGLTINKQTMRRRKPMLVCPPCSVNYSPETSPNIPPDNSQIDQENRNWKENNKKTTKCLISCRMEPLPWLVKVAPYEETQPDCRASRDEWVTWFIPVVY